MKAKSQKAKGTPKILARHHTGKLRHHRHTSYGALAAVLLLAAVPLTLASQTVAYASTSGGGDYGTYAVVEDAVPRTAPTIVGVSSKTYTTSAPIRISGTCPANTLVKLFKNDVLSGATLCQNGTYQMEIELFVGNNSLVARAYNANDVASPDSIAVSAELVPPGTSIGSSDTLNTDGAPSGQFFATTQAFYRGTAAGEQLSWPLILTGGQPPYAVSVSWGDGTTDLISRGDANQFDIQHTYREPAGSKGGYTVIVKATDQAGNQTYLQLVAIVKGSTKTAGLVTGVTGGYAKSALVRAAWQSLLVAVLVVGGFWFGERREYRLLQRRARRTA